MPLPTPILDNRSYQQIRDELIRRIPAYAPEWTDHNASDPGITLIELFSFLAENVLFRFNQIPEATKIAFLRLLQIPLRPASPARAMVAMTVKDANSVIVPPSTEARAGSVAFETSNEVRALPISIATMCRFASAEPATPEEKAFAQYAVSTLAEGESPSWYRLATVPADPNAPDAVAVDFAKSVDGALWMVGLASKELLAACAGKPDPKAEARSKLSKAILSVGLILDEAVTSMDDVEACPGAGAAAASHAVVWQISTGRTQNGKKDGPPLYRKLVLCADSTRGLAQSGVIQLELPGDSRDFGIFSVDEPGRMGTGDLPPELEDPDLEDRALFWIRAFRQETAFRGRVAWVGANAAEVLQSRKARPEYLGTGTADAGQSFALVHKPVLAQSVRLEVEEPGGFRPWQEVDSFHASHADDRHFTVDLEAGQIRFGNGIQGFVPQIGQRIRVVEYRHGGGLEGNVPAKAIDKLLPPEGHPEVSKVKIQNPLPARGGAATESVAEAMERIPAELRRRDRAVTEGDFRELALGTPGADVGRAECLPRFHPPTKLRDAAGVVSVVVWPREDRRNPSAPTPDRTLLRAVCSWLDARRLITTELYVIPPTYRKVSVSVGVKVKPGYAIEGVRRWVEQVLRQYLAPLPPYGPDGQGYPLGRRVHGPELMAVALQVEGVEYLEGDGLLVFGLADDGTWKPGPVELAPYEVPELVEITVQSGEPAPNGVTPRPTPPTDDGETPKVPVPVPTIKVEC